MFPQKDMPDLRIEPATSCTAVERGYDRASQAGIYFTMILDRITNCYDQDLCVLAKNSLIWIYTVFMHIHGHSRLSTMWYIIHSVYSIFDSLRKKSRIRNKQMFTNARAVSLVSYFL